MRIEVVQSTAANAHALHNLYPLYLHDLSEFSDDVPNEHGIYEPEATVRTLAEQSDLACHRICWEKPGVLFPFLFLIDGKPGGFALISTPPYAPADVQFCVQEFFVARPFRGRGLAERAAVDVFERFRGKWVIGVLPRNQKAIAFWKRTVERYTPSGSGESSQEMYIVRFDNSRPTT